ncbi:hypothetical protein Tco_0749076 [Tanacetum coccineum]|uniref:Uncharacterized protein n=1 Tax=Tanacetum coccineum TaxID=301880 RepID=A0ABQ4YYD1_9ASTR
MDLKTAQIATTAKLPILKRGEYDMWRLRIEQYFQVQNYALWDVIENGNSFKPVAQTTTNADGTSTSLIPGHVTTKEKAQKKNDVKATSMLLMILPNEHLMIFNQYKDAKTLFAAIQTRFGGNEATKKTQKTILKQMYENFSAPSIEFLDTIFNRLKKIRNKPDLDTMSFDDLYNNFKILLNKRFKELQAQAQVLRITANTQDIPSSTQVSTVITQVSTANLSDDTVYMFLASQPNGSQLVYEDLEQLHEDDIEEIDLKWQLALLSMRTRRGPRNQDCRNRNQDRSIRTVNVEETSSKSMVVIDGAGFDWSYMADKEVLTNMALMDFSDSEEFQQPKFEGYGPKSSKSVSEDISNEVRESPDAPLVEELVSDDKLEKKTIFPTVAKMEFVRPKQQEKLVRKPVKYAEMYRSQSPRGNQGNWNNQKLTAITIKGKVLLKTSLRSLNTARPVTTAHPKTTVYCARPMSCFSKSAQSTVNAVKASAYWVWRPTKLKQASACWVWRPTKLNSASITLKRHNYVDARDRSKSVMAWGTRPISQTSKPLMKDENAEDVDVHLYRSMIGSLMYLKGQPKLGIWYPKDSPFDLEAYTDSNYAGASLDRKSTIGGCQFLGSRLILWQCKKQTIVANCCGQVLWIQNQMLDYGYNFMNTKIFIDNESTICIVKNPVFHTKTKHIEIRHHFIRDSNENKLI